MHRRQRRHVHLGAYDRPRQRPPPRRRHQPRRLDRRQRLGRHLRRHPPDLRRRRLRWHLRPCGGVAAGGAAHRQRRCRRHAQLGDERRLRRRLVDGRRPGSAARAAGYGERHDGDEQRPRVRDLGRGRRAGRAGCARCRRQRIAVPGRQSDAALVRQRDQRDRGVEQPAGRRQRHEQLVIARLRHAVGAPRRRHQPRPAGDGDADR